MSKSTLNKFLCSVKLKTVFYGMMLVVGGMFFCVQLYTVMGYSALLTENFTNSKSNTVRALVRDRLVHHHYQNTLKVAAQVARDLLLRRSLTTESRQEIIGYLNNPTIQAVFVGSGLDILEVRVLSRDFKFLANWQSGDHNPVLRQKFLTPPASGRVKIRSHYFEADDGTPLHTLIFPVGGAQVQGYLLVITSPLASLAGLGDILGVDTEIRNMAGVTLIAGQPLAENFDRGQPVEPGDIMTVEIPISFNDGEPFLNVVLRSNTRAFPAPQRRLNLFSILMALIAILLSLYCVSYILKISIFSKIRKISETMSKIIGGQIDVNLPPAQNDELAVLRQQLIRMAAHEQDRNWLNNELVIVREAAKVATRAKSEFLTNMSHELRTPLNAIIGFSDIMASDYLTGNLNDKYREYANDIRDSGIHLLNIINDILDISRIESGKVQLNIEPVAISEIIGQSIRFVGSQAKEKSISIENRISEHLPLLHVDERLIFQMVANILSNAVKFTPYGGNIMVNAGLEKDDTFCITVVDDGIGIADDQIDKVGSPFCQVSGSYTKGYEGTGLGLSLVKAYMEHHGGRMCLQSRWGVGTSVYLIFPSSCLVSETGAQKGAEEKRLPIVSRAN